MKTRFFITALIVLSFGLFYSCNTDGVEGGSTNYWDSNALTRMKLRGAVHTMTEKLVYMGDETVYTFNTDGNLTSKVIVGTAYSISITYSYENGKLSFETNTSTNRFYTPEDTTTTFTIKYRYENAGKYIHRGPVHLYEINLVPALSAVIFESSREDYVFHGSNLWIVQSKNGVPEDTTIVEYSGGFPSSAQDDMNFFNNTTYATNGMFLTYDEGTSGPNFEDKRAYTFQSDDTYLLVKKVINTYMMGTTNEVTTTNYTYNDQKDMTEETSNTMSNQWANYVYDSAGNWTSRQFRFSTGVGTWGEFATETRNFTYY